MRGNNNARSMYSLRVSSPNCIPPALKDPKGRPLQGCEGTVLALEETSVTPALLVVPKVVRLDCVQAVGPSLWRNLQEAHPAVCVQKQ